MRRRLLLDASAAIRVVVAEVGSDLAQTGLDHALAAPDLLMPECSNVLCRTVRKGELPTAGGAALGLPLVTADHGLLRLVGSGAEVLGMDDLT